MCLPCACKQQLLKTFLLTISYYASIPPMCIPFFLWKWQYFELDELYLRCRSIHDGNMKNYEQGIFKPLLKYYLRWDTILKKFRTSRWVTSNYNFMEADGWSMFMNVNSHYLQRTNDANPISEALFLVYK